MYYHLILQVSAHNLTTMKFRFLFWLMIGCLSPFLQVTAAAPWNPRHESNSFLSSSSVRFLPLECPSPDWAAQTLKSMSLEQKIAQLIFVQVYSNTSAKHQKTVVESFRKNQFGGVCFFDGGPVRQIRLTNQLQAVSKIPLIISIDGEWGPSMRLDSCLEFPRQMALGALPDSDLPLISKMGQAIARQCRTLGIHLDFAPCVDINNNSQNPVINSRSFGESRELVANRALAILNGMRMEGVACCAKHFPGHGDTRVDSHLDLPVINKSRSEIESLELYPFRELIDNHVDFVMVGHLNIRALDSTKNSIASLSKPIVTDLLRNELGFKGLVISDALGMNGLRNSYKTPGEAEVRALLAGVDVLLMPNNLQETISYIKNAVRKGRISEDLIDEHCLRVLRFKSSRGLDHFEPLSDKNVFLKMNSAADKALVDSIEAESITLLRNDANILPIMPDRAASTLLLCIGGASDSAFFKQQARLYGIGYMQLNRSIKKSDYTDLMAKMAPYSTVIVTMLSTNQTLKYNYGIYKESVEFLNEAMAGKNVILSLMGNPYALQRFTKLDDYQSVIVGYDDTKNAVSSMLRCVFAKRQFTGKLPVSVLGFSSGTGYKAFPLMHRTLRFTLPSVSALPDKTNYHIDSLVQGCIDKKVLPGCQVMALQSGKVVFYRNFGFLKYNGKIPVNASTMYDLASMTKALATTLAVMKLYDNQQIKLNDKVGDYLDYTSRTPVGKITIAELLTHTSGLAAFIGFYRDIATKGQWDTNYLHTEWSERYSVKVAENVFLRNDFPDLARKRIATAKLGSKKYVYSDLNFILLKDIVEKITGEAMDEYLTEHFYLPMGLRRTGFNPREFVEDANIAPTEDDHYFRNQVLQGYVHDQSAAIFGGVSGNAGLFSTAQEVSVILSMLMKGGKYEGVSYLSEETVRFFETTYPLHGCKRRGLGFDTPSFAEKNPVLPPMAGSRTFGHQGFTGTVFWCDPDNDLIYIFLSNRVYPNAEPNNLSKSRLRLTVHEEIYKGLGIN